MRGSVPVLERSIWVHSPDALGFLAADRLIGLLRARHRDCRILLTCCDSWHTGELRVQFPNDLVLTAPSADPASLRRFLGRASPKVLIVVGTPDASTAELCRRLASLRLPLALVNADAECLFGDGAGGSVAAADFAAIALRSDAPGSAPVPSRVGTRVTVTGALEFDPGASSRERRADMRQRLAIQDSFVVLVAGLSLEEEPLMLELCEALHREHQDWRLILATVEQRSLAPVEHRLSEAGISVQHGLAPASATAGVWLLESALEMHAALHVADCIVLGGSFAPSDARPIDPAFAVSTHRPVYRGLHGRSAHSLMDQWVAQQAIIETSWETLLEKLRNTGREAGATDSPGPGVFEPHHKAANRTLDAIVDLLPAPEPQAQRSEWWSRAALPRFSRSRAGGLLAKILSRGRIEGLSDLRSMLGQPDSIVCLGNGPSSDEIGRAAMEGDCLIRVNWQWMGGQSHRPADLVVVGCFDTVARVQGCIYVLHDHAAESVLLIRSLLRFGRVSLSYLTMTDMATPVDVTQWRARPSSGALMIVLAAALQPKNLTIAGVDLFSDPRGRYVGAFSGTNAYAQEHDREVDLEVIREALKHYTGRLSIIGDALQSALAAEQT